MIIFRNSGVLDIRSVTTFGLSSKDGQEKIGRFGTGLKYALSTIVRGGGSVKIYAGKDEYEISVRELEFRGADHSQVTINGEDAPFTTSLGRDWKPWMAFRELYSNALDEEGEILREEDAYQVNYKREETYICVTWNAFESIYFSIEEHFIAGEEPIWANSNLEVYSGRSKFVFYRGIAVMELKETSAYRYNIKSYISLTEDRTAQYPWMVEQYIAAALTQTTDENIAKTVSSVASSFEKKLDFFEACETEPSPTFIGAAATNGIECNDTAAALVKSHMPDTAPDSATIVSPQQPGGQCLISSLSTLRGLNENVSEVRWIIDESIRLPGCGYAIRNDCVFLCHTVFEDQHKMNVAVFQAWDEIKGKNWLVRKLVDLETQISEASNNAR